MMTAKQNGDSSAYPITVQCRSCNGQGVSSDGEDCKYCRGIGHLHEGGMTKLEMMAMFALRGIEINEQADMAYSGEEAVRIADSLLCALAQEKK